MGVFCLLCGTLHGEVSPDVAALRANEHSAFRVVPVVDEGMAFPVAGDKVTPEAVFKMTRIVQAVVKPDDELPPAPSSGLIGLPIPALGPGIHDPGLLPLRLTHVVGADSAGLFYGVDAFADGDLPHDLRDVAFQGFQLADPLDQFILVYAHFLFGFFCRVRLRHIV